MTVTCSKCRKSYDDVNRWTICPHNNLNIDPLAVYCRNCDVYVGYTNIFTLSDTPNNCVVCGRSKEEILNDTTKVDN